MGTLRGKRVPRAGADPGSAACTPDRLGVSSLKEVKTFYFFWLVNCVIFTHLWLRPLLHTRGLLFVLWKRTTELNANTHKSFGEPGCSPSATHSGPRGDVLPWEIAS